MDFIKSINNHRKSLQDNKAETEWIMTLILEWALQSTRHLEQVVTKSINQHLTIVVKDLLTAPLEFSKMTTLCNLLTATWEVAHSFSLLKVDQFHKDSIKVETSTKMNLTLSTRITLTTTWERASWETYQPMAGTKECKIIICNQMWRFKLINLILVHRILLFPEKTEKSWKEAKFNWLWRKILIW